MATWYDMLKAAMEADGEDFAARICTLSEDELKVDFDDGFGPIEGRPFTAWGERWVYFPLAYDGEEKIGHAPRNPCDIAMEHQGQHGAEAIQPQGRQPQPSGVWILCPQCNTRGLPSVHGNFCTACGNAQRFGDPTAPPPAP